MLSAAIVPSMFPASRLASSSRQFTFADRSVTDAMNPARTRGSSSAMSWANRRACERVGRRAISVLRSLVDNLYRGIHQCYCDTFRVPHATPVQVTEGNPRYSGKQATVEIYLCGAVLFVFFYNHNMIMRHATTP